MLILVATPNAMGNATSKPMTVWQTMRLWAAKLIQNFEIRYNSDAFFAFLPIILCKDSVLSNWQQRFRD